MNIKFSQSLNILVGKLLKKLKIQTVQFVNGKISGGTNYARVKLIDAAKSWVNYNTQDKTKSIVNFTTAS